MVCEVHGCRAYTSLAVSKGKLDPLAAASVDFDRHLCRGLFVDGPLGQRAYNSCWRAGYKMTSQLVHDWHMALPDDWQKGCGHKSLLEIDRVVRACKS